MTDHLILMYFHQAMNSINILLDILKQMVQAHPDSVFLNSLYQQYCNRGGLSKKQLEGLYSKASKTSIISQNKLATLEAIIKKKPTRERAAATIRTTEPVKDEATIKLVSEILVKYPGHKRVLFLKMKLDNNELLSAVETEEVKRFGKMLLK
jgi:3-hydroxyacyl-CoA dehydrogenase